MYKNYSEHTAVLLYDAISVTKYSANLHKYLLAQHSIDVLLAICRVSY